MSRAELGPWRSAAQASRKVGWGGCPACHRGARWSCHQWGGGACGLGNQLDVWARAAGPQLGVQQACAQSPGSLSLDRLPCRRRRPH